MKHKLKPQPKANQKGINCSISKGTCRTLRNIILRSFPITRDTCWQSAPSLLVKSPTVSESKKDISYKRDTAQNKLNYRTNLNGFSLLDSCTWQHISEPAGEGKNIMFPSFAWPAECCKSSIQHHVTNKKLMSEQKYQVIVRQKAKRKNKLIIIIHSTSP